MFEFVRTRLLQSIPVLIAVSAISFLLLYLLPGDPAFLLAGENATAADIERIRQSLGLDDPLPVQYVRYMGDLAQGDFGTSIRTRRSVTDEITSRLGNTILLAMSAMLIATVVGGTLGLVAAAKKGTWIDAAILVISTFGVCVPVFWIGLLVILLFGVKLDWLPTAGSGSLSQLIMPATVLSLASLGTIARLTRASMIDVFLSDFIRTARAKGLTESAIIRRHVLRNGLIPTLTIVGVQLGTLLAGAVLTETVFNWPGIGRLLVSSVLQRDYPIIRALLLLFAVIFVTVNIIVDMLYAVIDPRIRAS